MTKLSGIGVIIIIVGVYLFGRAYHDIDLSANLINNAIMAEQGTFGILSNSDIYLNGMQALNAAELAQIAGMLLIIFDKSFWRKKDA